MYRVWDDYREYVDERVSEGEAPVRDAVCVNCFRLLNWDFKCPFCSRHADRKGLVLLELAPGTGKRRERRFYRWKVIKKRKFIVRNIWKSDEHRLLKQPGRAAKWNLSCNCWLCKYEKKARIEKPKYRYVERT